MRTGVALAAIITGWVLASPAVAYHCRPLDVGCSLTPHPPIIAPDPGGDENAPLFPLEQGERFGFNELYNPEFNSASGYQLEADTEARAGANLTWTTFDWPVLEPQQDVWDEYQWGWRRQAFERRLERGVKSVIVLLATPMWARDQTCFERNCPPAQSMLHQWRAYAAEVTRRFPEAAAIEVWNEPNLASFWPSPDPARYAELMRHTYSAVKSVDPDMPVLGGSLAGNIGWQNGDWPIRDFLQQAYAAGMKDGMDILSIHNYPFSKDLGANTPFAKVFDDVRTIKSQFGDGARRIWVDELGHTTTGSTSYTLSLEDQATELMRLSRKIMSMPDVDAVVIHTLFERRELQPTDPERGYGVMFNDTSPVPKPAYCAFVTASGNTHPGCT